MDEGDRAFYLEEQVEENTLLDHMGRCFTVLESMERAAVRGVLSVEGSEERSRAERLEVDFRVSLSRLADVKREGLRERKR
jgi:hypothetical protein